MNAILDGPRWLRGVRANMHSYLYATGNGLKDCIQASAVNDQADFLRADDERIKWNQKIVIKAFRCKGKGAFAISGN